MPELNTALERAQEPPFQQRRDLVDARHNFACGAAPTRDDLGRVLVAQRLQAVVAAPSVGAHAGSWRDSLLNEGQQALGGHVLDAAHADSACRRPTHLGCEGDAALAFRLPAGHTVLVAPDVGLVDFDVVVQAIAAWTYHGAPKLVQPYPRGLVAAQPEDPLKSERVGAVLLARDEPHRQEPRSQRLACSIEHRARSDRRLALTCPAVPQAPRGHPRGALRPAVGTDEAIRPAKLRQVPPTCLLCGKPSVELLEGRREVHAGNRLPIEIHAVDHNILRSLESRGYPLSFFHANQPAHGSTDHIFG